MRGYVNVIGWDFDSGQLGDCAGRELARRLGARPAGHRRDGQRPGPGCRSREGTVSTLRISLFGKLALRWGEGEPLVVEAQKAQELLCFLLLHRERPQPRELLASVLWADLPGERGRQYLRKA